MEVFYICGRGFGAFTACSSTGNAEQSSDTSDLVEGDVGHASQLAIFNRSLFATSVKIAATAKGIEMPVHAVAREGKDLG